ncbi:acyl--CoA ligase [bacterium]|nr:acyl--CoA ligase [bacterium]
MILRTPQHFSIARLLESLEADPERLVLRVGGRLVFSGELLSRISAIRASLRAAALSPQDVVAISAERNVESLAAVLACWAEGLTPLPLDYRQDTAIICQIMDGVRAKGCHLGELLDADAILSRIPYLRWKAVCGRNSNGCQRTDNQTETSTAAGFGLNESRESVVLHSAGVCTIPHTVRLETRSLMLQFSAIASEFALRESDVIFYSGTFATPASFSLLFAGALMQGASVSLDDPTSISSPIGLRESERAVILLSEARDHHLTAEQLLLLKGAKSIILTDSPLTDDRVALVRRATDAHIFYAYYCAEAGGFLCVNASPELWPSETVGVPVRGVEVVVLDVNRRPIHDSSLGRIAFRFSDTESDTWILTGDWGRHDERGLLHVEGCERSVIWKAGFPVLASTVEEALRTVHGVKDAWVFGIPDREVGEEVTAHIAISDPALTIESVLESVSAKLPAYMIPHEPLFVTELPSTPSGKKIRRISRNTSNSSHHRPPAPAVDRGPNLAAHMDNADLGTATQN